MRFYLDLKRQIHANEDAAQVSASLVARAVRAIDGTGDWTPVVGSDLHDLVNDMASQLPRDDADAFLSHIAFGFRSRALEAGLTGSVQCIELDGGGLTSVRLRIRAFTLPELEARLPTIGLELTNLLVEVLPDAQVGAMIIWKERNRKPVLEGEVKPRGNLIAAVRVTAQSAFVMAFSLCALTVLALGAFVQVVTPNHFTFQLLASDAADWFKRLVGPFLTAVIASSSVVYLEWRRSLVPTARWFVEGSKSMSRNGSGAKSRRSSWIGRLIRPSEHAGA